MTEAQRARALMIRAGLDIAGANLPDEVAQEIPIIYRPWRVGEALKPGDIRRRGEDALYRVNDGHPHTTQADWLPEITPAVYTRVYAEEFPPWTQPLGAHDAPRVGAKCTHNGKQWINEVDYNVYEPGVYGWKIYENP